MTTIEFKYDEGQDVKLKADPEGTRLMVTSLIRQNGGNNYSVGNGLYSGVHSEYELLPFNTEPEKKTRQTGFRKSDHNDS